MLVLGMHRSGTSALTRVVSLLGADLPATLLSGTAANLASNAKGHWESELLVRLNDEILTSAGISWRSPELTPEQWYDSVRLEQFRDRAQLLLESEFGQSPLFVFKDPRVCKLVPFWLSVLEQAEIRPAIVNMVRSPGEVADSLLKRNGLDRPLGLLMWLRYALCSERDSRGRARAHLSYDGLLQNWQDAAKSVSGAFDITWPSASMETAERISAFLSESDRHHWDPIELTTGDDVSSWAAEVFAIFSRWVEQGENGSDHGRLDAIATRLDEAIQPLLSALLVSYQKSAIAQKLQNLRSDQNGEIERLKGQLQVVHDEVATLATEAKIPVPEVQGAPLGPGAPEATATEIGDLVTALRIQRAASDRALSELQQQHDQLIIEQRELRSQLESTSAELALKRSEQEETASRLAIEMSELLARHERDRQDRAEEFASRLARETSEFQVRLERDRQDMALREARVLELLDIEREQRLAVETKLSKTERINATLLIVRGRFEAASEDIVRVRAEREEVEKRLQATEKQLEEAQKRLKATQKRSDAIQAQLGDVQKWSKEERDKLRDQRDKLHAAVQAVRDDRSLRLGERDSRIKELSRAVKDLKRRIELEQSLKLSATATSKSVSAPSPIKRLWHSLVGTERQQHDRSLELVKNSGYFDANYYRERYQDLQGSTEELLEHFVRLGGSEGRAPSAGFDSRKYLQEHPDVAAAGLNPLVHFLERGTIEGRKAIPADLPKAASPPDVAPDSVITDVPTNSADGGSEEAEASEIALADEDGDAAISNTPSDDFPAPASEQFEADHDATPAESFSGLAAAVSDWVRSAELLDDRIYRIGDVPIAIESPSEGLHSGAALLWFVALTDRPKAGTLENAKGAVRTSLCHDQFTVDDAWLVGDFGLRLRLSAQLVDPVVIRCCQAAEDGSFSICLEQPLSNDDSTVLNIRLVSRFNPILFVLTDRRGQMIDSTLIPFPTLLRGGIHHGELIYCDSPASGWAAHEDHASALLTTFADQSTDFAIRNVRVALDEATGTEPVFSEPFREWLARLFKVEVLAGVMPPHDNPALAVLAQHMRTTARDSEVRTVGRTLVIDANCIPSLRVLLAREDDLENVSAVGTIVVDELTRRPLRAVNLPILDCDEALLRQAFEPAVRPPVAPSAAIILVSITFSMDEVRDVRVAFPLANGLQSLLPNMTVGESAPISVIISCNGSVEDLRDLLISLARQQSVPIVECLLIGTVPDVPDSLLLPFEGNCEITLERSGLEDGPHLPRLHAAVQRAIHEHLLLVDDQKVLHDPRTLDVLRVLCTGADVGTAGCHLVTETRTKGPVVKYLARAGYLPLSRDRHPQVVTRPAAQGLALPQVYPVVANPVGCMMIPRVLWPLVSRALDGCENSGLQPSTAVGLAMIEAGKLNLSTSIVSISDLDETDSAPVPAPWLAMTPQRFVAVEEY